MRLGWPSRTEWGHGAAELLCRAAPSRAFTWTSSGTRFLLVLVKQPPAPGPFCPSGKTKRASGEQPEVVAG